MNLSAARIRREAFRRVDEIEWRRGDLFRPEERAEVMRNVCCDLVHRAYLTEIQPFVRAKANAEACHLAPVTIFADGRIERGEPAYSPQTKAALAQVDAMLDGIKAGYERVLAELGLLPAAPPALSATPR